MTLDLTEMIRGTIEKEGLGEESEFTPTYPTGIDLFDYRNGRVEDGEAKIGVDGGKILTIIGKSGTGKTAFGMKVAKTVVEPYEQGQVFHLDFERATNKARIAQITGWNQEKIDKKYILMNRKIYSESLYTLTKSIAKIKLDNFEALKIDTGKLDRKGEPIFVLPPTVILIDSWALVVPKNITEEEDLSGQMSATAIAKTNNAIIKRITGTLEEANIMLIIINHITQKIEIGMVKTQAQLNYLKQDESIPGGTSAIYLANTLLKLQASSKLEEEKDFGIKGFKVIGELIKSRSNEAGNKFEIVYHQQQGHHNDLTNFNLLKGLGLLKGNGRAYYFENAPNSKFTQKNFLEKLSENSELRSAFNQLVEENLAGYLSGALALGGEEEPELELVKHIRDDIWEANDGNQYHYNEAEGTITEVSSKDL